jgi:hypothetical protein
MEALRFVAGLHGTFEPAGASRSPPGARDLVRTCHRRGGHAMGGTAALVPSCSEPDANEKAIAGVREDKKRVTREIFERVALGEDFPEFLTLIAYDKVD